MVGLDDLDDPFYDSKKGGTSWERQHPPLGQLAREKSIKPFGNVSVLHLKNA